MARAATTGRRLMVIHAAILTTIAALAIGTMTLTRALVEDQAAASRLAVVAERQRMLVQKGLLQIRNVEPLSGPARDTAAAELADLASHLADSHTLLRAQAATLDVRDAARTEIERVLTDPDAPLNADIMRFSGLLGDTSGTVSRDDPGALGPLADRIMMDLGTLAHHFKAEGADALRTLRLAGTIGLGSIISLLGLQAAFVVRPLLRRARIDAELLARANTEARQDSLRDTLTGLPNRRYLGEHLERLMAIAARSRQSIGLLAVDLHNVRATNAAHGRAAGDAVLVAASRKLEDVCRRSDFLARIGGDEFIVVCPEVVDAAALARLAERIVVGLGELSVAGEMCDAMPQDGETAEGVGCAIGIAMSEDGDMDPDQLITEAEIALYDAKTRGAGAFEFFAEETRAQLARRAQITADLARGLDAGEIDAFYQPQISARTGEVVGFEALLRWCHPEKGALPPGYFLDAAVEAGLGERIAETVTAAAVAALAIWRRRGFRVPRVSLNIGTEELRDDRRRKMLIRELARNGLKPGDVTVEIRESVLLRDKGDPVLREVERLADAGFGIELDDFGTGLSPLASLQRLRVQRLKIDRSLVGGVNIDPEQQALTRAVIDLADSLGIGSLAEGVETPEEWRCLARLGCDVLQGYGIGKPMSGDECAEWMATYRGQRHLGPSGAVPA